MRLILTILLIGLFKAEGQMVINASQPYRPTAQPAANLLLDDYPNAAAAYSLRKLRNGYTGSAIRVRKDTTGQPEQDIGFIGNELDTISLKNFLNARNGFVVNWYDQSTNNDTAFQTTQANQPRIASLGVIDRQNGKPTLIFDGNNDHFNTSTITDWEFLHFGGAHTNFTVAKAGNVTDPELLYILWGTSATIARRGAYLGHDTRSSIPRDRVLVHIIGDGTNPVCINSQNTGTTPANIQFLSYLLSTPNAIAKENRSFLATNGGATQNNNTSAASNLSGNANHSLRIGTAANAAGTNLFFLAGNMQELIFYNSNQSTNKTGIETNINNYYSIY